MTICNSLFAKFVAKVFNDNEFPLLQNLIYLQDQIYGFSRVHCISYIILTMTMVKALTQIVSVDIGQNLVSMSIAEKQNDSGISFNERLFVVVHGEFFGYMSKVKMTDEPSKLQFNDAKVKIPIKNLYSLEANQRILKIKFTMLENGKLIPKQWIFKMASEKLAALWKQLMDYQIKIRIKQKSPTKNPLSSSRLKQKQQSNSKSKDLSVNKKNSEISQTKRQLKLESEVKKTEKKQDKKELDSNKKPIKVFENPFFQQGSDSDQQEKRKRKRSQLKNPGTDKLKKRQESPIEQKEQRLQQQQQKFTPEKKQQKDTKKEVIQESSQLKKTGNIKPLEINSIEEQRQLKQSEKQFKDPKNDQPKNRNNQEKLKLQSQINLPRIIEEAFEQTPLVAAQKIKVQQYRDEIRRSNSPLKNMMESRRSQIQQTTKIGKDQSNFINEILLRLDQKNQILPIQQINYDHFQVDKVVEIYGKKLGEPNNQKNSTEILLNRIMQTQREKMKKMNQKKPSQSNRQQSWIFKQFSEQEIPNLLQFNSKCCELTKILYTELHNKHFQHFTKIKQQDNIIYLQIKDIQVKVPLISFQQAKQNSKIKLIDCSSKNKVKQEFKYLSYLYKIIANRGRIHVPYASLYQFGGVTMLFKVKGVYNDKISENYSADLEKLETFSYLPLANRLKDNIKPLKQFYYNQMRQGDKNLTFKLGLITSTKNIFISDLNQNKLSQEKQLRPQLFQRYGKQKSIQILSNKLIDQVNQRVIQLNNGQFYFVSPSELSNYLHKNGINIRYLGSIYTKINDYFLKSIIISEIIARTIKKIICKTLQDDLFEHKNGKQSFEQIQQSLKAKMWDLLNCIFGNSNESNALWELISCNTVEYYQVNIENRQNLNKGQLLVSVFYHCKVALDWKSIQIDQMFHNEQFIKKQQIQTVNMKRKSYQPIASKMKDTVELRLSTVCQENFNFIVQTLKLKQQKYPKELYFYPLLVDRIRQYLSNFVQPEQIDWANNYSHLAIYETSEPSALSYFLDLNMIKWHLRTNNKQKYLSKFSEFTSKISKIYGNNHPFLSQLYKIFCQYHKAKGEGEDSINFMKSLIINFTTLSGENNFLAARNYLKLSELLIYFKRQEAAIDFLTKSKQIIERLNFKATIEYGKIRYNLGFIYYHQQKYSLVLEQLSAITTIFEKYQTNVGQSFELERTEIYQMIYNSQVRLSSSIQNQQLSRSLQQKCKFFKDHNNFKEILLIIVQVTLSTLSRQNKQAMFKIIQLIPTKIAINYYKKSFDLLKTRYQEKTLFVNMRKYFENSSKIVSIVIQKNLLSVWENFEKVYQRQSLFDFICFVEQLIYLIGKDRLAANVLNQ